MNMAPDIKWVRAGSIDRLKWDQCMDQAENSRIYGYSWYLDAMAENWDALVLGDHEWIMPLPWRSIYGIRYIYQPFLCAQLGIFGKPLTVELTRQFIEAIPACFRLAEISLNPGNSGAPHSLIRNNYVLDLRPSYEQLYQQYRENIQRNTKKAFQLGCQVTFEIGVEQVIGLALSQMHKTDKNIERNIQLFNKLYELLKIKQEATIYGINGPDGQLLASAVFFFSKGRAYYILVGNHPNGRTIGASHALIDAFIKDHSGQQLLLDFEGSDIRNLAFFYSSFGAGLEQYPFLKWNRLPAWLKWLKS